MGTLLAPLSVAPTRLSGAYQGKTVLVTGHTGFKGAWLSLWLTRLGAKVVGVGLHPPTRPSLFDSARLDRDLVHVITDVRDRASLEQTLGTHRPELVFHLAAQPLVRRSYREPVETYETNVMGTVNLLEAVRRTPSVRACVVVTSDKCYENREWAYAYRENDAMGGYDPYSSSKGCAELVAAAYRNSYFHPEHYRTHGMALATVRAGNVVGGGDWAEDRIVPDCIRALMAGRPIQVRNPAAIRPWQHVLEPLSGYLWLGAQLMADPSGYADGWNFGPHGSSNLSVREVVEQIVAAWGEGEWECPAASGPQPHEAHFLKLDITKATNRLGYQPLYGVQETFETVVDWYAACHREPGFDAKRKTLEQIEAFERRATQRNVYWAQPLENCDDPRAT